MPPLSDDLKPVRDALRRMTWELNLGQPAEPAPPDGEGVDWGRGREASAETVIELLNEIDDLTSLLANHALSTIVLEANLGADLDAATASGLIERARITFATDEGENSWYEPQSDAAAADGLAVTTRLLRSLAALRAECGVEQQLEGRESALHPPRLSPDTLPTAIAYLRRHSTLEDGSVMEAWHVNPNGWEAWR